MKKHLFTTLKGTDKSEFSRGPIQKRILAITLIGILLICIFIGFTSSYIFRNYLKRELIATSENSLSNLAMSIDSRLDSIYRMAKYCQGSSDISRYIEASPEPGSVLSVATFDRLYEEYQNNDSTNYIPRVVVFTEKHFLQACSTTFSTTANLAYEIPQLSFFDQLLLSSDYDYSVGIIEDPFLKSRNKLVIPIIRPITYKFNSDQIGYLYMEFSASLFTDYFSRYYMEKGSSLYLTMSDHVYLYSDGALLETSSADFNKAMYVTVPLHMPNCSLVEIISPVKLKDQTRSFLILVVSVLSLVILIGLVMTFALNHYINKPLTILRKRISLTAQGDFSRDPNIEWPHELGDIGRGINELADSVNHLLEQKLSDEKQKRDLEYKMLQNQINPHFIYNTLNSINMMASIQGATGISEMTTALGSLLRSISKGTSLLIPINEELQLLKYYFTIQNYRYGGMIEFNINLEDPAIGDNPILKFTLQPLVENAIFHGLEPKGGTGQIDVSLKYINSDTSDRDVCIEVRDDGVGMDQDQITRVLSDKDNQKTELFKEIGIMNVNNRLQYEFGNRYGISIESVKGQYTIMRVIIPEKKQEVDHV